MTDRPINFRAPMIRALLDGRKSMTRRILKPQPKMLNGGFPLNNGRGSYSTDAGWTRYSYSVGDRLWCREAHALVPATAYRMSDGVMQAVNPDDRDKAAIYRCGFDRSQGGIRWRPSIHMPRWASRLTLIVTDVRVERLQGITEEDARAEGVCETAFWERAEHKVSAGAPWSVDRLAFADLWNSIHGPEAWALNPWVAALTFTVHHCNIDQMPGGDHE